MTLRSAVPASLIALSLMLAACGGGDDEGGKGIETSQNGAKDPTIWPFTGLEVADGDTAELDRPPLVVKIPNTDVPGTQVGLSKADMVIEQMVEGRTSRLAAIYYSQVPKQIGPIRSMRATDIGIAGPVGGLVIASGGAQQTIDRFKKDDIKYVGEGSPGFYRESGRAAPYDLFINLKQVAKAAEDGTDERPANYLPWGSADDLPAGKPATGISADFGNHTTNWSFQQGTYVNESTFAAEGDEFKADSVLVIRVKVVDAGYTDAANNPVPESKFVGTGPMQLFHDGKVIEGTWSKDELTSELTLKTADGDLKVPAGKVWIELVPNDASEGAVTFTK